MGQCWEPSSWPVPRRLSPPPPALVALVATVLAPAAAWALPLRTDDGADGAL
jgi:hypothetical protein